MASFDALFAVSDSQIAYTCIHGLVDKSEEVRQKVVESLDQNPCPFIVGTIKRLLNKNKDRKVLDTITEVPIPNIIQSLKQFPKTIEMIFQLVFDNADDLMICDYWNESKNEIEPQIKSIWEKVKTKASS